MSTATGSRRPPGTLEAWLVPRVLAPERSSESALSCPWPGPWAQTSRPHVGHRPWAPISPGPPAWTWARASLQGSGLTWGSDTLSAVPGPRALLWQAATGVGTSLATQTAMQDKPPSPGPRPSPCPN